MQTILGIDPGTTESGWCLLQGDKLLRGGVSENTALLQGVNFMGADILAIEVFEARGMPIGHESIETILYTGRVMQEWAAAHQVAGFMRVKRSDVKRYLCGSLKAKDSNVRQALLDMFGGKAAIGTKKNPGMLYGIASHAWAALGVAVTAKNCIISEDTKVKEARK